MSDEISLLDELNAGFAIASPLQIVPQFDDGGNHIGFVLKDLKKDEVIYEVKHKDPNIAAMVIEAYATGMLYGGAITVAELRTLAQLREWEPPEKPD